MMTKQTGSDGKFCDVSGGVNKANKIHTPDLCPSARVPKRLGEKILNRPRPPRREIKLYKFALDTGFNIFY